MKKLRLLSWNVNGIRAIHRKKALEWFIEQKPDMLCMQEIKANAEQVPAPLMQIDGYHKYFFSADKKGYSGVGLFSKLKPKSIVNSFGVPRFDTEGRTMIADFDKFILCNIYFPNGKASNERLKYKLDYYEAFLEFIDNLKDDGNNIVICGDVNTAHKEIDLAHPKENEKASGFLPEERAWIDKLIEHGYHDTFRMFNDQPGQYTWWDMITRARERNVGWRIDYFFVSDSLKKKVKDAFILPDIMGSDHCPIGIDLVI
jgi:exodeoxyribonuclease-3